MKSVKALKTVAGRQQLVFGAAIYFQADILKFGYYF